MKIVTEERRRLAFRRLFEGEDAEIVLSHLSKFCHEFEDTFAESERRSCHAAGQRSVILEIRRNLKEVKEVKDV